MIAEPIPQEIWGQDFASKTAAPADWLWHGFISRGSLTLLTSLWKAGKTTLLAMLLARRDQGGTLAGLPVQPGKSVVISEEPLSLWAARSRQFGFGNNVCFFPQPFRGYPTAEQWQALIDRILHLQTQHGLDMAVIDPLAPFCQDENHAKNMMNTLRPLSALTRRGMAVVLLHHPSKGDKPFGQAARGSGALLGHVDISIEMRHPGGDPTTRRRRFITLSRHSETQTRLMLELNPQGTDYLAVNEESEDEYLTHWEALRLVLLAAPRKLTRQEIQSQWPPDHLPPTRLTLWRWLDRAYRTNVISREGAGTKTEPFVYWLPEKEEQWNKDPLYTFLEEDRLNRAKLKAKLGPNHFLH